MGSLLISIAFEKQIPLITRRVNGLKDQGSKLELYNSTLEQSNCIREANSGPTDKRMSVNRIQSAMLSGV
jgi:hypothetical protein